MFFVRKIDGTVFVQSQEIIEIKIQKNIDSVLDFMDFI